VATLPRPIQDFDVVERLDYDVVPEHPAAELRGFERVTVPFTRWLNTTRRVKAFVQFFGRTISANWIGFFGGRRWKLHGMEAVKELRPERGVVLVSNHRSFFDMYVTSALLYKHSSFMHRLFFPVRTNFFYTNPVGLLINLMISGCAMWPPVFRDERKALLNPISMQQVSCALAQKGAVLGFHPEGTRGKGPDPYELLPAKAGIGQVLRWCHPDTVVLPLFIVGMTNSVVRECGIGLKPLPKDGSGDIRVHFSEPVTAGELSRNRDPQEIAEELMATIGGLAEQDKSTYGAWAPPAKKR
jgi:1-acyl-sn-glycerol-3-phosphate acyltransferase